MRFLKYAVLAILVVGATQSAHAQNGRIRGVVRDAHNIPLAGAVVRAVGPGPVRRATTGDDGSYSIADVAAGTYTVSASLPGVRTQQKTGIQVAAGAEVQVDFVLTALELEAITVTAMKREEQLIDVPLSIAAPTEQALRIRGVESIEQVAQNVAGFSVQNLGPGQSQPAIRGASSGQISRDQPGVKEDVGAYLDESVVSLSLFTPDLDLFDVGRVEVLRGPQGTLFGSGSLAGTVRYISNQPELGISKTFGEVGVTTIEGGDQGSTGKLGFNAPIGDKVAARIVGYSTRTGGWIDAVRPDLTVQSNINGTMRAGVRAAMRFEPSSRFHVTPRLVYQSYKADGWNRNDAFNILANPYTTTRPTVTMGPEQLFNAISEPYTDEFLLSDLNLQYNLSATTTLTSITSYTHRKIRVHRDGGALYSSVVGGSFALPENIYTLPDPFTDHTNSTVWTQEARLAGRVNQVQWLVGGFYAKSKRAYGQDVYARNFDTLAAPICCPAIGIPAGSLPYGFTEGPLAPKDHLFFSDLDYELRQTALFGEATVAVTPKLDLTAGARWYDFKEDRTQFFDGFFVGYVSQPGSTKANGLAPRFIASYKASDNLVFNAQASRGFRLGGINDPLNKPICSPADTITFGGHDRWNDETVWNYEAGMKSRIANGRGSLNIAAFYMDIKDLQLNLTAGTCSSRLVYNVPKARSAGLEFEFTAQPTDHWDLALSAGFNDAILQSTVYTTDTLGVQTVVGGVKAGNRLPSVPRAQGSASITYSIPVGTGRASRMSFTGSGQYVGSHFTQIDDLTPGIGTVDIAAYGANMGGPMTQNTFTFNPILPAYTLMNLRVGLSRSSWEAALFLNNVTNERALLALDRERGLKARVGYLVNQPRTVGVSLRFDY
ncbi:MAG TPA: TonB-dependent receptor [Gemmatimonadales bacterium]